MFRRSPFRRGGPGRQRGALAMIAILTLFALMTSYLVVNGLARTQADVNIERNRRSLQAMQEAKAALIIYAASRAWTTSVSDPLIVNDQPGALPCPASNNLGNDPGNCATASTRIGRLPWKTIRAADLRDASGEVLWYALSANFRKASGTTVINSDTQGTLTVTGTSPASNVVAIIIAPGAPLSGQNRLVNSVANYLEGSNAGGTDTFLTAQSSETFNDQIVVITQADLMAMVEPAVAARIERDIKPYLTTYLSQWSAFPFPALFASPNPGTSGTGTTRTQSNYTGDTNQSSGLLPLNASASYTWSAETDQVALTGGTADNITTESCTTFGSDWRCDFDISARNSVAICGSAVNQYCIITPGFRVAGRIGTNAGRSFASLPSAASVTTTLQSGSHPSCRVTLSSSSISGALTNTGLGTVNFTGNLTLDSRQSTNFICRYQVTIPVVVSSPLTSITDTDAAWFIKNEWYRQTYYAVSPGFLPGSGSSCTAGSTCLTVNSLPTSYPVQNDKRAILIFAGRAFTGSRPSSSLSSYLEGENQTPADRIYAHRSGSILSSNDSAIVVAP